MPWVVTTNIKGPAGDIGPPGPPGTPKIAVLTNDQTVSNTTEAVISGCQLTLPANSLVVGSTFQFMIEVLNSTGNVTTPRVRLGPLGTIVDPTVVNTVPSTCTSIANSTMFIQGLYTIRATGVSAATKGNMTMVAGGSAVAAGQVGTNSAAVNINTAVTNIISLTIKQNTNATMTVTNAAIELLN